jgi:hypothetical protein
MSVVIFNANFYITYSVINIKLVICNMTIRIVVQKKQIKILLIIISRRLFTYNSSARTLPTIVSLQCARAYVISFSNDHSSPSSAHIYICHKKNTLKMRTAISAKVFFYCLIVTAVLLLYMSVKDYSKRFASAPSVQTVSQKVFDNVILNLTVPTTTTHRTVTNQKVPEKPLKYILQWTAPQNVPFVYMGQGQEGFKSRNCPHTNCIVTANRDFLEDVTKFDVIAFSGPEVIRIPNAYLPRHRSPKQKYVFASIESSHYYPVCSNRFDGFFNWTWTFRLDSEVRWGYMLIKDSNNNTIGPNKIMHWMDLKEMDPVSKDFKEKLGSKKRAVAWFVSNCFDKSGRLRFAMDLKIELKKYGLQLDIYGKCGTMSCPRDKQDECDKTLDKYYYFYLSFENSFSEDYVTEKLLHAVRNNIVPIVYGGANYTRYVCHQSLSICVILVNTVYHSTRITKYTKRKVLIC